MNLSKTSGDTSRAAHQLAKCLIVSWLVFGAASTSVAETSTDATLPDELTMQSEPLEWMTKRFFRDNPGCINAKVDIWFWRGRYAHQLFTARSGVERGLAGRPASSDNAPTTQHAWEGGQANPTTRQIVDADSTTVFVGRGGCRYRVRIERVE